jgi:type I restriction enzyme S subunit
MAREYSRAGGKLARGISRIKELIEPGTTITYGVVQPGREDPSGVLFIRGGDIANGQVQVSKLRTITSSVSEQYERTRLRGGELVVSLVGNPGQVAIVPFSLAGANIARQVGLIRLRKEVDANYIKYYLLSPQGQDALGAHSLGSVQQVINLRDLKTLTIPIPSLREQSAISHTLTTLDDKIELNCAMNATLEQVAQALFKSWFVDFDPVTAKAAGRAPEGMDAETAALFPSEFEESALGQIPKGWHVGKIADVATNARRATAPSEVSPDTPYIGLEHMPRKSIALSEWGRAGNVISGKSAFDKGDILFGKLRPYFHKVGVAPVDGVCSTDVLVVKPSSPEWFGFLLAHLSSTDFINYVDANSGGTRMPRTDWESMSRYEIVLPCGKVAERFTQLMSQFVSQIHANIAQSNILAEVRDSLLPKLISGQLRIPDAERMVEVVS